MMPAIMLGLC